MVRGLVAPKQAAPPPDDEEAGESASQQGAEAAAPGGEGAEGQQGQQATPEEQAAYENFIKMAQQVIYPQGRVNQAIIDRLALRTPGVDESQQAVAALASVTVNVVLRVQDSIKQGGAKIAPGVMYHAASEVMSDLADLANHRNPKTGKIIHNYTPDEIKGAWIRGVDLYQQHETASGDLPKGIMNSDWGQIVGAAKAGNLGAISPALKGAAAPAPAQPGAEDQGGENE